MILRSTHFNSSSRDSARSVPPADRTAGSGGDVEDVPAADPAAVAAYVVAFLVVTLCLGSIQAETGVTAPWQRVGATLVTVVALGGIGAWFWRARGAGFSAKLFVCLALAALPLCVEEGLRLVGLWPASGAPGGEAYIDRLQLARAIQHLVTIPVTIAVMIRLGFPFLMCLVGLQCLTLAREMVLWILGENPIGRGNETASWASIVIAVLMAGIAAELYHRSLRRHGMWLAIVANLSWFDRLAALGALDGSHAAQTICPIVAVVAIAASLRLRALAFLVFGVLTLYGWASYMACQLSGWNPFVFLVVVNVSLIIPLVALFRWPLVEAWLEPRFGPRRSDHGDGPAIFMPGMRIEMARIERSPQGEDVAR